MVHSVCGGRWVRVMEDCTAPRRLGQHKQVKEVGDLYGSGLLRLYGTSAGVGARKRSRRSRFAPPLEVCAAPLLSQRS